MWSSINTWVWLCSMVREWRGCGNGSFAMCRVMLTVCSRSQGILLCPQTLSQARRERLRRAFTDATSETVTYVKTVGVYVHRLNPLCLVQGLARCCKPTQPCTASRSSSTFLVISNHWAFSSTVDKMLVSWAPPMRNWRKDAPVWRLGEVRNLAWSELIGQQWTVFTDLQIP